MSCDLTTGPVTRTMLRFAFPLMAGNLLQQVYNLADTWIVGQFLGSRELAAVGSAYTFMTFLTSILLGLCMGSGAVFSMRYGEKDLDRLRSSAFVSFVLIGGLTVLLNIAAWVVLNPLLRGMQVPADVLPLMREYLWGVFWGIGGVFLYNYFASLLRAIGNSIVPLVFLAACVVLNIALDLLLVLVVPWGIAGAAAATAFSQLVSGIGLGLYTYMRFPWLRPQKRHRRITRSSLQEILRFSGLTCLQQSVMNFGILLVQGLVNSFGTAVMAAFAAAVKIDSFAYMPVQDFGNAFSTFVAQNHGAGKSDRIRRGIRSAGITAMVFSLVVSALVWVLARPLLLLFIHPAETEILRIGVEYLRIEGAFYVGIGCLFLLYGYYRAIGKPGISVVLTVISLGTRVMLAYLLATIPAVGVTGIWWSVPIGWLLADLVGILYYLRHRPANRFLSAPADL